MDNSTNSPQVLYRFWDEQDRLLYVGISVNFTARLNQHYKNSPFFRQASYVTLEHYPDRASVEAAELKAIESEGAIYNKAYNPDFETVTTHFGKIVDWVYRSHTVPEGHFELIRLLRDKRKSDSLWTRKNTGPIAYHFLENYSEWAASINHNCEFCDYAVNSNQLVQWSSAHKRLHDGTN